MIYLNTFESYLDNSNNLIIIDVQKYFRKYFTEMYLHKLKEYSKEFTNVYQIWDNHIYGKSVDKDYLYDDNPDIPVSDDLYFFPNQKELIEKRYNYDVDVDFYKKILDKDTYKKIKELELNNKLKKGDIFNTNQGTHIVYIGNNHVWFHLGKKLYDVLYRLKGKEVTFVGGSMDECFLDIFITAESLGVIAKMDHRYMYSATYCPIS